MKHLIKFNELKLYNFQILGAPYLNLDDIKKIKNVYDELKYIIEDEGFGSTLTIRSGKTAIIVFDKKAEKFEDALLKENEIEEQFEEFYDRIKEELGSEFKINTEDSSTCKTLFIDKSLDKFNESKSERRNVVRQVVKDIIKIFKKEGEGDYILPEEISREQEYKFDNLETSFTLELEVIEDEKIKTFALEGGYFVEDEIMELCIVYNPKKFPEELYNLTGELNELVRHELQHLIQYDRGDDQTEDNSSRENYYSTPHELDAQIKGFKRISKLKGVPLEQVVRDWFEKNKKIHRLNKSAEERVIKKILSFKDGKVLENFNKSEFTFHEILQDLRDDFEIWFLNRSVFSKTQNNIQQHGHRISLDDCLKETDATHDMFFDIIGDDVKRSPLRYELKIINNSNAPKSYDEMYDQIEEVVDRFEEKNMYVYSVYFGMVVGNDRKYVALPNPDEKWYNHPISGVHPHYITIEFQSNKRNLEPTTKFGKFIDRFRNKTQTKYSEYTNHDTGPR